MSHIKEVNERKYFSTKQKNQKMSDIQRTKEKDDSILEDETNRFF